MVEELHAHETRRADIGVGGLPMREKTHLSWLGGCATYMKGQRFDAALSASNRSRKTIGHRTQRIKVCGGQNYCWVWQGVHSLARLANRLQWLYCCPPWRGLQRSDGAEQRTSLSAALAFCGTERHSDSKPSSINFASLDDSRMSTFALYRSSIPSHASAN
jgi:hypothetical protein